MKRRLILVLRRYIYLYICVYQCIYCSVCGFRLLMDFCFVLLSCWCCGHSILFICLYSLFFYAVIEKLCFEYVFGFDWITIIATIILIVFILKYFFAILFATSYWKPNLVRYFIISCLFLHCWLLVGRSKIIGNSIRNCLFKWLLCINSWIIRNFFSDFCFVKFFSN